MPITQEKYSFLMKSSIFNPSPYGASEQAIILDDERFRENGPPLRFDETVFSISSIINEIESVASECSEANWDGYQSEPLGKQVVQNAKNLVSNFPRNILQPEIVPEPDGSIGFEWDFDENKWMIISVDKFGNLYYAVKFDKKNKSDGQIDFSKNLLKLVFDMVKIIQGNL